MGWLENLEQQAADRLPEWLYAYAAGGAGDGLSLADAPASWDRVRLRRRGSHVLRALALGARRGAPRGPCLDKRCTTWCTVAVTPGGSPRGRPAPPEPRSPS